MGVGQRTEPDIGIGRAFQALIMGDGDAADHHLVSRSEAMHVEAAAAADRRPVPGGVGPVRLRVALGRHLEVLLRARHQSDGEAGGLGHRRVVGELGGRRLPDGRPGIR
jgi:hypothetical protein